MQSFSADGNQRIRIREKRRVLLSSDTVSVPSVWKLVVRIGPADSVQCHNNRYISAG